jgi:hypothetical protein
MTITLHLSPDTEHKLLALAEKNGQDLEALLYHLLETLSETTEFSELGQPGNGGTQSTPELVDKDGVHVVRAQAVGDLDNIVQCERNERLDALTGPLKA